MDQFILCFRKYSLRRTHLLSFGHFSCYTIRRDALYIIFKCWISVPFIYSLYTRSISTHSHQFLLNLPWESISKFSFPSLHHLCCAAQNWNRVFLSVHAYLGFVSAQRNRRASLSLLSRSRGAWFSNPRGISQLCECC